MILLRSIPSILFAFFVFGLIGSFVRRSKGEVEQSPASWAGLILVLLVLEPMSKLPYLALGFAVSGPLWYFLYRRSKRLQPYSHPEALLLAFCTTSSISLAGGLSGVVMAMYLYSLGVLEEPEFWQNIGVWRMLLYPFLAGTLLAPLRRAIRLRWAKPIWVPYAFQRRGDGSGTWVEGRGLWLDEVLLSVVSTPILWAMLLSVHTGWSGVFMFGHVFAGFVFYVFWAFLNRFWLRLVGIVDRDQEMLYLAYERLIARSNLAKWLGEIRVDWDGREYAVSGALPSRPIRTEIKTVLKTLNDSVDVESVAIDPQLAPNPWFQSALARKGRRSQGFRDVDMQ